MELKDSDQLRREWKAKGSPACAHPKLTKEYDLGAATGDYICTTCGESGWGPDWNKTK